MSASIRRSLIAVGAATALLVSGCGGSDEGEAELTVYLSAPLSGPRAAEGRDIADAARLALADAGGEAAGIPVALEILDDAGGGGWDAALTGANARVATQDSTTIAYIGELDSGASRTSIPITNEAGVLQVSPGSGAEDLTRETPASEDVPPAVQPSGVRTFGRVIPSDRVQGRAAGVWMAELGITAVAVSEEGEFGAALVDGLESASPAPAIVPDGQSEATFFARDSLEASKGESLTPSGENPIFAPDALLETEDRFPLKAFAELCASVSDCPNPPREIRVTAATMATSQLPPEAADFLDAFKAEYGKPGPYAAYGYEAMAAVLDSIERADDPLDRTAVVESFLSVADRQSILGTYSIDAVGDTSLAALGAYEIGPGGPVPEPEPLDAG